MRILIFLLTFSLSISGYSQKTKNINITPSIENVKYIQKGDSLVVTYDIINYNPNDFYFISGEVIDSTFLRFKITEASGAFGKITPGVGKTIYVDLKKLSIIRGIYMVNLNLIVQKRLLEFSPAIYSAFLPGLGDYIIKGNKTSTLIITGAFTYCVGYAIYHWSSYKNNFAKYQRENLFQSEMNRYFDLSQKELLKSRIASLVAAGIWATDVTSLVFKGRKNRKINRLHSSFDSSVANNLRIKVSPTLYNNWGSQISLYYKF